MSGRLCYCCKKKYKSCSCKSCRRCDTAFQTSFGLVRDRSHCRNCNHPVCLQCYNQSTAKEKTCNVCQREQKRTKLQLWDTPIPTPEVKQPSLTGSPLDSSEIATASMSDDQKKQSLFDAAKEGDHHVMTVLLEAGIDVNSSDENGNTALFYAVENGHTACVALLVERKANIHVKNKVGWTVLHALAWNGNSVECAEWLTQMGVDIFARSTDGCTAYSLAVKSNRSVELVEYLAIRRAIVAVERLKPHISEETETGSIDGVFFPRELCTYLTIVVEHFEQHKDILLRAAILQNKPNRELPLEPTTTPLQMVKADVSASISKQTQKDSAKSQNDKAKEKATEGPEAHSKVAGRRSTQVKDAATRQLQQQLDVIRIEKQELEEQCQNLVETVANVNAECQREIEQLKKELQSVIADNEDNAQKIEAEYKNRLAKIEKDTILILEKTRQQLEDADAEKDDLLVLQQSLKLTWVPDRFVRQCANAKCLKTFTQRRRRHHCRCCGRVFCKTCAAHKTQIPSFGYIQPVRVCQNCYDLMDDLVSGAEIRERPPGESEDSEFEDLSVEASEMFGYRDTSQQQ